MSKIYFGICYISTYQREHAYYLSSGLLSFDKVTNIDKISCKIIKTAAPAIADSGYYSI